MNILEPLYQAVTFIMVAFHTLFDFLGVDPASGLAWGGSIVGLVVVIRILLIPLFVKQIKAQRGLQLLQPEMKKIQTKYKGRTDPESKQKQQQEMMKLYRDNGTNPLASCLPILAQAPIFFALFHVLNGIGQTPPVARGFLDETDAKQAADATIFGAPLSDKFLGSDDPTVQIVTAVLIVLMSATTFITQKQLMSKNMPASAMDNPFAKQQKMLLYIFPLVFAVSGVNFPVGVLLYWLTTNLWSMGQQFYVIRRNPAPDTPAYHAWQQRLKEKEARRAAKRGTTPQLDAGTTVVTPEDEAGTPEEPKAPRQRQQPKRKPRAKRPPGQKPGPGGTPADPPGKGDQKGREDGDGAEPAAS